jgi:hypothetical protein
MSAALFVAVLFGLQAFAESTSQIEQWKNIISQGELLETNHDHIKSIQLFQQAGNFAVNNKLPGKYFETALCRQAAVEVQANMLARANPDCDRLMALIAREKTNNTLDPELEVWVLNLANAYQARTEPQTREQCLLKLSQINKVLYGDKHREYKMGQELLGKYYQNNQTDQTSQLKAAQIQITADEDGLKQAEQASDAFRKGYFLNDLASRYRTTGQLDRAKAADLELVKMSKVYPQIADGLVGYYASLGSIEIAQHNVSQGKTYFDLAIKQASKIKGNKQKEAIAIAALDTLAKSVKPNKNDASTELKELLSVQEAVSTDPRGQYTLHRLLASILEQEKQFDEAECHMERAIEIANLPTSMVKKDVPALYTQLATSQVARGQIAKSNETFAKAFAALPDKTGFEATRILIFWGGLAAEQNRDSLAEEKLSLALKNAEVLSPEKRGTLLIDALHGLAAVGIHKHAREAELRPFLLRRYSEIQLQRKINSGLGPDFFQRLNAPGL